MTGIASNITGESARHANGGTDSFVAKVNGDDGILEWSSYLGGNVYEGGTGIAIDGGGNAWVTGFTTSPNWAEGGFDTTQNGSYDAYIARINADGSLAWSSYLGGTGWDGGQAIAIDGEGNAWVAGRSNSPLFTSGGSVIGGYSGYNDIFVAKIKTDVAMPTSVSIAASDSEAAETGRDTGQFIVTRSIITDQPLSVNLYIDGTADNGIDYDNGTDDEPLPTSVTILANQASAILTARPVDDDIPEGDETVTLILDGGDNYVISDDDVATVTIVDSETTVWIEATDPDASEEGTHAGQFTISRTGNLYESLDVLYTVSGTADEGTTPGTGDYVRLPGFIDPNDDFIHMISIPSNNRSVTFSVNPVDDNVLENDENVTIVLAAIKPASAPISTTRGVSTKPATIRISDNESDAGLGVYFLDNNNAPMNPDALSLNVSNYPATLGLPAVGAAFGATAPDPDVFRLQVRDIQVPGLVKLQVVRNGVVVTDTDYTLDKQQMSLNRGDFLRLVADTEDDGTSGDNYDSDPKNQTIKVKLGDIISVKYAGYEGFEYSKSMQVGRPDSEDDNGALQLRHDIRKLKVRFVVLQDRKGKGPTQTRELLDKHAQNLAECFAQATIQPIVTIDFGTGDHGVPLPDALKDGITWTKEALPFKNFTDDERALIALKDQDPDSIDIFFTDQDFPGALAVAYPEFANETGVPEGHNFIVVGIRPRTEGTIAHEVMHILLNSGHRADPFTSLFRTGWYFEITKDKILTKNKRIGPYLDSGVGKNDTSKVRNAAESLPRKGT